MTKFPPLLPLTIIRYRAIFPAMNKTNDNIAKCFDHAERRAIGVCAKCGAYLCPECVSQSVESPEGLVCAKCSQNESIDSQIAPPWETTSKLPGIREFLVTWRSIIFRGRLFFPALPTKGPILRPIIFAAICIAIGFLGGIPASLQVFGSLGGAFDMTMIIFAFIAMLFLAPLIYAALFFATSLYLHLIARGLGGDANFKSTLRVASYAQAGAVAEVLPLIGTAISFALRLVFYSRGITTAHKLQPLQSISFALILGGTAIAFIYMLFHLFEAIVPPGLS